LACSTGEKKKMDTKLYGYELILDVIKCNSRIENNDDLKTFASELCKVLDMKAYGDPRIEHFGHNASHTAGYTLIQLIETSSIVAHFSEEWDSAHINIFSCKPFSQDVVVGFVTAFFECELKNMMFIERHG
jgi:hypothetical protein